MSIIRSNIARQLLAEGGAPRSPGNTTLQRVLPRMDGLRPGFYGPDMGEGGKESDFGLDTYSTSDVDFGGESGGTRQEFRETAEILGTPKTPRFSDTFRANQLKKQKDIIFGDNKPNLSFIANILARPQREVYNKDIIGPDLDQYGISGKNLTRARDIQKAIDNYEKTGRLSQSDFEKAFFGPGGKPPRGEGGDNEPIIKLKAPITEKIEEKPKREFDDILKFYGARFAKGGRTDVESQYGADTYGSYSYEDDRNRDDDGPPTVIGGGREPPPMLTGGRGRGIDVEALQNRGLTPAEIATVFNEYYGLENPGPTVAGPLGTAPGGLTGGLQGLGTAPGGLTGGLKGLSQPTNLDDLRKAAEDIGRAISDPSSPFGQALDFGKAAVGRSKMYEDVLKADGGEVRQNYGLGSIVKKATRALKKVAKSPLGKAALAFGAYKLAGSPSIFGKDSFIMKNKALSGILGASLAAGLFSKQEEEDETLPTVSNTDPQMTRTLEFYGGPRRFAEDGGDIEDAPIEMASNIENDKILENLFEKYLDMGLSPKEAAEKAKEEFDRMSKKQGIERTMAAMGGMMEQDEMLDLGGNEMDLRGGGFVPLGEYEKKDDVPARLSKNEFVFTADAVRAAGGGSVDKGADVMYKTMKTLENKVA